MQRSTEVKLKKWVYDLFLIHTNRKEYIQTYAPDPDAVKLEWARDYLDPYQCTEGFNFWTMFSDYFYIHKTIGKNRTKKENIIALRYYNHLIKRPWTH